MSLPNHSLRYTIPEPLLRLITAILDAAGAEIAVISAPDDISTAAQQLLAAPGNATSFSQRKVEAALEAFRTHVAGAELVRGTAASVPDIVTPRMFEQMLLSRARAARRHIVLPEGTEERILQAAAFLLERDICRITLLGPPDVIKAKAAEVEEPAAADERGEGRDGDRAGDHEPLSASVRSPIVTGGLSAAPLRSSTLPVASPAAAMSSRTRSVRLNRGSPAGCH